MGGAAGAAAAGLQGQGIAPAATGSAIVVVVAGGGGLGHEGGSCWLAVCRQVTGYKTSSRAPQRSSRKGGHIRRRKRTVLTPVLAAAPAPACTPAATATAAAAAAAVLTVVAAAAPVPTVAAAAAAAPSLPASGQPVFAPVVAAALPGSSRPWPHQYHYYHRLLLQHPLEAGVGFVACCLPCFGCFLVVQLLPPHHPVALPFCLGMERGEGAAPPAAAAVHPGLGQQPQQALA
mmetsp:Transcript_16592/g.45548  ORF Transcript_16592/g.45548 Transcript_16592/m.45548 type:complete len:233 (+) Transcript_16592:226-924(+)